jgi:hypothetical protein
MVEHDPSEYARSKACPQCGHEVDTRSSQCGHCSYDFEGEEGEDERATDLQHRQEADGRVSPGMESEINTLHEILLVLVEADNLFVAESRAASVKRLYDADGTTRQAVPISHSGGRKSLVSNFGWPTLAENGTLNCSDDDDQETLDTIVSLLDQRGDGVFADEEPTEPTDDRVSISVIDYLGGDVSRDEFEAHRNKDNAWVFVSAAADNSDHHTPSDDDADDSPTPDPEPPFERPPEERGSGSSTRRDEPAPGEHPLDSGYDYDSR